ncbi:MAG TPA: lysophospholipid acyltransferase family protein [Longimicrobiales bacterium]|nr:lysophospholipid acyltransferase family protein [Longimicrobiales bacterium]
MRNALYWLICWLVRTLWRLMGGYDVRGLENIPKSGPFIVVANHQSYLDAPFLQAACPRILHAMAKSTQFSSPVLRWAMTQVYAFPVRRFEVDPNSVRLMLRRLSAGEGVVVYIEGERTWDGELQSPRLGTVRVILKAGVPVIPCRIDGSYDAWPRWSSKVQRRRIRIDFRKPLEFPKLERKNEREAVVTATAASIMRAIG